VIDKKKHMVTARRYPQMVLIEALIVKEEKENLVLQLNAPGMEEIRIRLPCKKELSKISSEDIKVCKTKWLHRKKPNYTSFLGLECLQGH
jgi:uncharacterized protein YcbX